MILNRIKKHHYLLFILFIALTNYQIAKLFQRLILNFFPSFSYVWSISLPWVLLGVILCISTLPSPGIKNQLKLLKENWSSLFLYSLAVCVGLLIFYLLGVTKYFHSVKNPIIFFIFTPIAEELIFRGWIYDQLEKMKLNSILGSSVLFGLHHLQYFRYIPTPFAIFQVSYTFVLGLLFGKIRQKSGGIYLSIALHMLINWFSVSF